METKPKRRFQFSLRTMLVAVALISIPVAWCGWQWNWTRPRRGLAGHQPPIPGGAKLCSTTWTSLSLRLFGELGQAQITWRSDAPYTKEEAQRLFPDAIVVEVP